MPFRIVVEVAWRPSHHLPPQSVDSQSKHSSLNHPASMVRANAYRVGRFLGRFKNRPKNGTGCAGEDAVVACGHIARTHFRAAKTGSTNAADVVRSMARQSAFGPRPRMPEPSSVQNAECICASALTRGGGACRLHLSGSVNLRRGNRPPPVKDLRRS